jgi:hypothetical protein
MAYHKGYTPEQRNDAMRAARRKSKRNRTVADIRDREVIVWDGEGMKLSGPDQPQHYVLFGCSKRPDTPLRIHDKRDRLSFFQLAEYALDVAAEYPNALHLGYYFKYDQNMIIWSLPWPAKQVLYSKGGCMVRRGKIKYYVRIIFGKSIRITRINERDEKISMLIEDFAPFFASSFVVAYEKLFKPHERMAAWDTVVEGKKDRSVMLFKDLGKVQRYWRAEIMALEELAIEFRRLMFDAGFMLNQWHGPGALANYIRRNNGLVKHEYGGKEENLQDGTHTAIKGAYYGGHFEQFCVGYVQGPIHSYDINSAYPAAFCEVPSLSEEGFWRNVGPLAGKEYQSVRASFGVFYVRWKGLSNSWNPLANRVPQPFPHRDSRGAITFPQYTEGWYWAPEVSVAKSFAYHNPEVECEILDGWVWTPGRERDWPWEDLLQDMYARRLVLKRNNNPTQMAYKLGPNSLYGKYAQRAGGKFKAPSSHTLCIAGYVTSQCRAKIMRMVYACGPDSVISIETDGVFTTTPPEKLAKDFPISDKLGDWDHETYDSMILLQNGVYLKERDGLWLAPKTRGISARQFQDENGYTNVVPVLEHLQKCAPGERWPAMEFDGGESFIGLGAAIARATRRLPDGHMSTNPFKASDLHCTWVAETKKIDLEGRGSKRSHVAAWCRACRAGHALDVAAHDMVIHTISFDPYERKSTGYQLPWEKGYVEPKWHLEMQKAGMGVDDLAMV